MTRYLEFEMDSRVDFLQQERDGPQWAWSGDHDDYYTSQWNQTLSMRIWRELELQLNVSI